MIENKQTILAALERITRAEGYEDGLKVGFAEGYSQALKDMADFAKERVPPELTSKIVASPSLLDGGDETRQRRPKGENAKIVRQVLSEAERPLNPSDLRRRIEKVTDQPITYSSTRNALYQLKEEGAVEESEGLWSLKQEAHTAP